MPEIEDQWLSFIESHKFTAFRNDNLYKWANKLYVLAYSMDYPLDFKEYKYDWRLRARGVEGSNNKDSGK